jgi:hypothetical protein
LCPEVQPCGNFCTGETAPPEGRESMKLKVKIIKKPAAEQSGIAIVGMT